MKPCPKCSADNPTEHRFCSACGAPLSQEPQGGAHASSSGLRASVSARPPLKGTGDERKLVTVLFADLSGFTAMAETLDPEEVREMLNGCFERLVPVIEKYEGTVEKFIGDEIMAIFGAPVVHEDDAQRALNTAWEMRAVLTDYNAENGTGLDLHFGINTGLVVAGSVGARGRKEYAVTGDAVNLAARLEGASGRGEIFVGESTHRLTASHFEFEPLEPIDLKGKAKPVRAYRLVGRRTVPDPTRQLTDLQSSLVGRETESRALLAAVDRLRSGIGGIVTLAGEAGIGKSRLVAETRRQAMIGSAPDEERDGTTHEGLRLGWVEARCVSFGGSVPYLLWIELLQKIIGVRLDDSASAVRDTLTQTVEEFCPDGFDDVFPYLARLMALPLEEETEARLQRMGGQGLKCAVSRALQTFVNALTSQRGPMVIVGEDLHWADASSLELLESSLPLIDRAQLLVICLFRPDTNHKCWQLKQIAERKYHHRHLGLQLEPLSAAETKRLVDNLLSHWELPGPLSRRLLEHGEGNPFYVEELVRSLVTEGTIVWSNEAAAWRAEDSSREVSLPPSLQALLTTRIDHLESKVKRVLQLASVVGRVFHYPALEAVADADSELGEHLLTLEREELIRERTRFPEQEYIFKHQLTQEAAYAGLLKKERRAIHRRVAEFLEQTFPQQAAGRLEALAHHWEYADETEKATNYLIQAGEKARARYANTEALEHFQRALKLNQHSERYDQILARRAEVFLDLFLGKQASEDFGQLLANARRKGDRKSELESLLGLAAAYYSISLDDLDFAEKSLSCYEQAAHLAEELQDKAGMVRSLVPTVWFPDYWPEYHQQVVANLDKAWLISQELDDEALMLDCEIARATRDLMTIEQVENLVVKLEERQDLPRLKDAYFRLIWRHLISGDYVRCIECCEASVRLAVKLGVPPAMYATQKALALLELGRYEQARMSLGQEIAGEDYPFGACLKRYGEGVVYLNLMAYPEAEAIFTGLIRRAGVVGRAWLRLLAQAGLARALLGQGRSSEINMDWIQEDLAGTATTLPAEVPEILAEIAFVNRDLDEALRQVERACDESKCQGWRPCYLSSLELKMRILNRAGRPQDTLRLAEEAREIADDLGGRPRAWRISYAEAQALELEGQVETARASYTAVAKTLRMLEATIDDSTLRRQFITHPLIQHAIERGEPQHSTRAPKPLREVEKS